MNHSVLHYDRNTFVLETDNMKLASWHIKEETIIVTLIKVVFIFEEDSWLHRILDLINVFNLLVSPTLQFFFLNTFILIHCISYIESLFHLSALSMSNNDFLNSLYMYVYFLCYLNSILVGLKAPRANQA